MDDCIEVIAKLRSDLNAEAMKDGTELAAKLAAAERENARLLESITLLKDDSWELFNEPGSTDRPLSTYRAYAKRLEGILAQPEEAKDAK